MGEAETCKNQTHQYQMYKPEILNNKIKAESHRVNGVSVQKFANLEVTDVRNLDRYNSTSTAEM